MAGFEVGIINIIADNLRDRYRSGIPVLKEIIQNADDAAAQTERDVQLDFGFSEGINYAEHPLLQGPAIFFLNNGSFSEQDARAVKSFALNSKAAENTSIGKFGLGMKSVFHFCEAFFWLAEDGDLKKEEILNPWSRGNEYPPPQSAWDNFSLPDAKRIRDHLQNVFEKSKRKYISYFLLWLPLRKESQLIIDGKKVGSIISEFPGDDKSQLDFLFNPDLSKELSELLPLLRHLTLIQFWRPEKTGSLQLDYSIQLAKGSQRNSYPNTRKIEPLSGKVTYGSNNTDAAQHTLRFAGFETKLSDQEIFEKLRKSNYWPKSYVRNELGIESPASDSAEEHCAVSFARSSEEKRGRLNIQWAVFLPVEAGRETYSCESNFTYNLTLHGCFFIDAGRLAIKGLEDGDSQITFPPRSENDLRMAWNYYLYTRGTFSLLIPALNQFIEKLGIGVDEVRRLSKSFLFSNLFQKNRHHICRRHQWVLEMRPDGRKWIKINSDQKILPLPAAPHKNPYRPWETLPHLSDLEDEFFFVQKDAPHLTKIAIHQWDETALLTVLNSDPAKVFSSQSLAKYLNLFLQNDSATPFLKTLAIQKRLKDLIRQGFFRLGQKISQVTAEVQEFMSFVLPEHRYVLKSDAHSVIRTLQNVNSDFLILHKDFDSLEQPGEAQLTADESARFLENLDQQLRNCELKGDSQHAEKCRKVILEILKSLDRETRRKVLLMKKELKIIAAYDCELKEHSSFAIKDLEKYREKATVFLFTQGVHLGLSEKLQAVLSEGKVLLLNSETSGIVFGNDHDIKPCSAEGCLYSLGLSYKALSDENARADLVGSVSGFDLQFADSTQIRGFRYLLHGDRKLFEGRCSLWVQGYEQNSAWPKLWEQLSEHDEGNILINRSLAEKIPPDRRWKRLGLREIKQQEILDDIRGRATDFVQATSLSEAERTEILLAAQHIQELWQSLPLHETVTGDFVSITDSTYLEPKFSFPVALTNHVNIIKKSSEPLLLRLQKDTNFIQPLTEKILIGNILSFLEPHKFFKFILDALYDTNEDFDIDLLTNLRNTAWLVDTNATPLCPADVIFLPDLSDELSRLIAAEKDIFWQPEALPEEICKHPYFTQLEEHFFSRDEDGLEKLALLLERNPECSIGCLSLSSEDFSSMLNIFGKASFNQNLPGWRILQSVTEYFDPDQCRQHVLGAVSNNLSNEKLLLLFEWLEQQYNGADEQRKQSIFICYLRYLKVLSESKDAPELLARIRLLNQVGEWRLAGELCSDTEGISPSYLLNSQQQNCLYTLIHRQQRITFEEMKNDGTQNKSLPDERDLEPELQSTSENISEYFRRWEGVIPPEVICGFVSILGDDHRMLQLGEHFQGRHSVGWIRSKVPWTVYYGGWLDGLKYIEALSQHRLIVELVSGKEICVTSLTGEDIVVKLNENFSTLALGKPFYEWPRGDNIINVKIKLRRVSDERMAPDQFSEYLKSTGEYLLKELYGQKDCDLTSLWDELNSSEQLDVRIALRLVMKHIPFYLDQLGVHRHQLLKKVYNDWDKARYKAEEYHDIPDQSDNFQRAEEKSRLELQSLLETDSAVQKIVLESVRKKMQDFQYTEKNIPFELFQNADDAVVEQLEVENHPEPLNISRALSTSEPRNTFVVQQAGSNIIRFMHWGRPVNSVGTGGFPGRERGFHQDLEKMLILSSSNKNTEQYLTGKFGLGFKSVLLVSNQPRLLSGRLGVEIVAGIYPKTLSSHKALYELLSKFSSDNGKPGTIIELPLRGAISDRILEQFKKFAGILTVFSKTIRRIHLSLLNQGDESSEWLPEKILSTPEAELEKGSLMLWRDDKENAKKFPADALHFRCNNGGGLLVGIGSHGLVPFFSELPPIWVVAPTREKGRLGFCINGRFDVDAGRARLAGESEKNRQEAKRIGKSVGEALCSLFEKSIEDWPAVRKQLRLLPELTRYIFWESIWTTLTNAWYEPSETQLDSEVFGVVSNLLGSDSGLGKLIKEKHALPNGLWGVDFQRLIDPGEIRYVLRDSLSEAAVFKPLSHWELFKEKIDPDSVISAKIFPALGKILPGFTQKKDQWESLRLAQVLQWLRKDNYRVGEEAAIVLGKVITKDFLDKLFTTNEGVSELEAITKTLKKLKFMTQDGLCYGNAYLLRSNSFGPADDEPLRACFAPVKNVLHSCYTGAGLDFFIVCRGEMTAKAETMAEWAFGADTDQRKIGALAYIINGELGDQMAGYIRYRGTEDTWLSELRFDSEYFSDWEEKEIKELLFRKLPPISVLEGRQENENYYEQKTHVIEPPNVIETLENIFTWWKINQNEYLKKYEKRTYPDHILLDGLEDDDRSTWLTLFMIGSFHKYGRAKPEQHRGFLSLCKEKGWWDVFTKKNPKEHPHEWMNILEDYIDNQVEDSKFEYWMQCFPTIYKFARDIDDDIENLYEIEKQGENVNVVQLMAPKTSSVHQGGGSTAAPIEKTLGMGACFVLREMMRKDLFTKNHSNIAPYCYVPLGRVRNLFSKMRCADLENGESPLVKSKIIHDFLSRHLGPDKASFDNAFDIPFQFIAEELELQETLFV